MLIKSNHVIEKVQDKCIIDYSGREITPMEIIPGFVFYHDLLKRKLFLEVKGDIQLYEFMIEGVTRTTLFKNRADIVWKHGSTSLTPDTITDLVGESR